MWKCPNCQTVNSKGIFCGNCGTKMPEDNSSSTPKYILISIFVIIAIIIALIAFVIGFSLNNTNDNKQSENQHNSSTQHTNSQQIVNQNTPSLKGVYYTYYNDDYNFYCSYPASFIETSPGGANSIKAFKSQDGRALMTLRACRNPGMTAKQAYDEFIYSYKGSVEYKAVGNSWYAFSGINGNRAIYRKLFMKNDYIYCMDFEMYVEDIELYRADIEYIEDHFKTK